MTHSALLLVLLDSRSPAGAHHHSGGMEAAVSAGWVHDVADVEAFCRLRLQTSGRVAAGFAAAAAQVAAGPPRSVGAALAELDREFAGRTPSEAAREAARQLGAGLRRLVRAMRPDLEPPATYHPVVLGAAVARAGGTAGLAARAAALGACTAPASAAIRLLGLDPYAVHGRLAILAAEIDRDDTLAPGRLGPALLPADTAPALDLLADVHARSEVRLFAS